MIDKIGIITYIIVKKLSIRTAAIVFKCALVIIMRLQF